jgi:hypothetical protein
MLEHDVPTFDVAQCRQPTTDDGKGTRLRRAEDEDAEAHDLGRLCPGRARHDRDGTRQDPTGVSA